MEITNSTDGPSMHVAILREKRASPLSRLSKATNDRGMGRAIGAHRGRLAESLFEWQTVVHPGELGSWGITWDYEKWIPCFIELVAAAPAVAFKNAGRQYHSRPHRVFVVALPQVNRVRYQLPWRQRRQRESWCLP